MSDKSGIHRGFRHLPNEYKVQIQAIQTMHNVTIDCIQDLSGGGRSGAYIYATRISRNATGEPQYCVLKLYKPEMNQTQRKPEELPYTKLLSLSSSQFRAEHLVEM